MILHCANIQLDVSFPRIMGIVNVTPDSFSDGGRHAHVESAVEHAHQLIAEGAAIIDIGGESTRPGAEVVPLQQELDRVVPLLTALQGCGAVLSVDTRKPEVMAAAIAAGAHMINDIDALQAKGALQAVACGDVAVCLMHKQGEPQAMQNNPRYHDVVAEVTGFLAARIAAARAAGIAGARIVVDPGFGFGKSLEHNLKLLHHLDRITQFGVPVLVGISRKSMLGKITGRAVDQREYAGLAAHILAVMRGARILRVHDVAACQDALKIIQAVEESDE
ncbi:dihydropteroate synthase [Sulfuriferula plumbiphila]|uniref:Dihydropteroate synthase n=1 Tax=Sulfuriferula plumbiphila TaxID=171865 RepID=A0A512L8N4_9PROT|nr:dihydropteroate synthase [Sulfuriferula plumbiphila]BBP03972.1 dihydropteroate synthase [Sulfuriferula plumbiphila]GEP30511.1 dihydropteroate synthase [Sulfuriferula plumbiphila]